MDIDQLIADNMGLVYSQLHRFNMQDDDNAFSFGVEALMNAAKTFDASKGFTFATYATVCIYNALAHYLRSLNKKRQLSVVFYEDTIDGNADITYIDVLADPDTPETEYLKKELYAELWKAYDRAFEALRSDAAKAIISKWRESDFTIQQTELANEVGVTQSNVSRILSAFKYRLKKEMEAYLCEK